MLVVSSTIPHVRHKKLHLLFRADDTNATLQLRWFCSHCSELLLAKVNLDFISTKILRGVRSHNINKCSLLSKYLLRRKNIILFQLISPHFPGIISPYASFLCFDGCGAVCWEGVPNFGCDLNKNFRES